MSYAARVDANQGDIVKALRAIGATVTPTHMVADGFPDLVVGYRRKTHLIEVKDGSKPPSERKLTPDQIRWHAAWQGAPVHVVTSVDEAILLVASREPA